MRAPRRSEIAACAIALAATALLAARAWRIDYAYSIDFQTYWLAGSRVLEGHAADLYAAGGGPGAGTPVAMGPQEFKNLPLVAVAFAPLAAFDYATAKRVLWWGAFASLALAAYGVGRHVVPGDAAPPAVRVLLAFAAVAAMAPTQIALRHGQTTPFVAALVALYLAAAASERPAAAGVALGLACLVKFPPLALIGLDALRGRWRTVAWSLGTIASFVLVSVAVFGAALHGAYLDGLAAHVGTVITGHNNQSLVAVATRLLAGGATQDWTPRPLAPAARILADAGGAALLAATVWSVMRRRPAATARFVPRVALEAAAALALGLVVFPVAWDHYVVMLAPALVAMTGALVPRPDRSRSALVAGAVAAYVLLALPTPGAWIDAERASGPLHALVLSHYFAGAVVVIVVAAWALRRGDAAPVAARP